MGEHVTVSKSNRRNMKKLNRREFVKLAGIVGGYVLWPAKTVIAGIDGGALWSSKLRIVGNIIEKEQPDITPQSIQGRWTPIPGVKFGMVIDLG